MCELKVKEKKEFKVEITYTAEVGSFNTFDFYLSPLFGSFDFDPSFLILSDVISNNMPLFFL